MPNQYGNEYDDTINKQILVLNDAGETINRIWGTEGFAAFAYPDHWKVDPEWTPEVPEDPPEEP